MYWRKTMQRTGWS